MSTAPLPVLFTRELLDTLFTRDHAGNRLRVTIGPPEADGFYPVTIAVDYTDNIVAPLRDALEIIAAKPEPGYDASAVAVSARNIARSALARLDGA